MPATPPTARNAPAAVRPRQGPRPAPDPDAVLRSTEPLRPAPAGLKRWLAAQATAAIPIAFAAARRFWPIPRFGATYLATLHDDVREVFATDRAFQVPYGDNLAVITGGEPFLLGMTDTPEYRAQLKAMRDVVRPDDLPGLGDAAEAAAEAIVAASGGRLDVVDLVRRVAFDVLGRYFGVPWPAVGRLDVWATRLFEFQFASRPGDLALRAEVEIIAPAFRDHIDREIARRKAAAAVLDDVLGRSLAFQAQGVPGYSDRQIRTGLLCMMVGGPPQPPMVVPKALEQLLRRPAALAAARAAAAAGDDDRLRRIVREAMRFDPLAPGAPRRAVSDWTLASGAPRAARIPEGATVIAGFASAMMDARRLADPARFDPDRREHEYLHFGHGLHECFGRRINDATLHRMLGPLLRRAELRRAAGPAGRLRKNGLFAERLVVEFDAAAAPSPP